MLKQVQHDEIGVFSIPCRHPELVTGSISPRAPEPRAKERMLQTKLCARKQVKHHEAYD